MSSMLRASTVVLLAYGACLSVPAQCQDGREWDAARAQLVASQRGTMGQAIVRWQQLTASNAFTFSDYAGFLLSYPGFPDEDKLQAAAERALEREAPDPSNSNPEPEISKSARAVEAEPMSRYFTAASLASAAAMRMPTRI